MPKTGRTQKLTKRLVDAVPSAGPRLIVWDSELPGFGLRVEPSGRKAFIVRYRAGGGRSGVLRQATIGRYGVITADEARAKARKLLGAAAAGGDPLGERSRARKAGISVGEVLDWYIREAEAGRILGRRGRPIKASTLSTDRGRIESHVKPLLGHRAMRSISMRDIEEMQADIAVGKTARPIPAKRPLGGIPIGGGGVGARTLAMVRAIFEHAVRRQIIDHNPAKGVRKLASKRRKFRLTLEQVRDLGAALSAAAAAGESPTGLAVIRFLLLSGFRRGEALGLRSGWILPAGGVDLPDSKSGPQVRPLGKAAMNLLAKQLSVTGNEQWIFPAERGNGQHYVGVPKLLDRIARRAAIKSVTPHSLRHSFASIAGDLGFSELVIAGLLGHSAGSVTGGYIHLDVSLINAANRVAAVISDALDGQPAAKIVKLREEAG